MKFKVLIITFLASIALISSKLQKRKTGAKTCKIFGQECTYKSFGTECCEGMICDTYKFISSPREIAGWYQYNDKNSDLGTCKAKKDQNCIKRNLDESIRMDCHHDYVCRTYDWQPHLGEHCVPRLDTITLSKKKTY